jgi:hypothetical protein
MTQTRPDRVQREDIGLATARKADLTAKRKHSLPDKQLQVVPGEFLNLLLV